MKIKLILVFLLLSISGAEVLASHYVGSDIRYRCVDPATYTYEVAIDFFRQCGGPVAPDSLYLTCTSTSGTGAICQTQNAILYQQSPIGIEVTTSCQPSRCQTNMGGFGVDKYIYMDTVVLPPSCGIWTLGFSYGNRNFRYNLGFASSNYDGIYIENKIYPTGAGNNSVLFANELISMLGTGVLSEYKPGAYDLDGDSLRVSFVAPMDSNQNVLSHVANLSPNHPLFVDSNTIFNLDTSTGRFLFTPATGVAQLGVVAILVEEIRNGTVVASTHREINFYISPNFSSSFHSPQLDSIIQIINGNRVNVIPPFISNTCGIELEFYYTDLDTLDTLSINFNATNIQQLYPDAVITTTYLGLPNRNRMRVDVDIFGGTIPNSLFNLEVIDNHCPNRGNDAIAFHMSNNPNACAFIEGFVFEDVDSNCTKSINEKANKDVYITITKNGNALVRTVDTTGYYSIMLDTGDYTLNAHFIYPFRSVCSNNVTASLLNYNDSTRIDFGVQDDIQCPLLFVHLGSNGMRHCNTSRYYIDYINKGTDTAKNAYLNLVVDSLFTVFWTSVPATSIAGKNYKFNLGDIPKGEGGSIIVEGIADTSCSQFNLGKTICTTVDIFPDTTCLPLFLGGKLYAEAACLGDSVYLRVINKGGTMTTPVSLQIIKNNFYIHNQSLFLSAGDSTPWFTYYGDGGTYRIEAYQPSKHSWDNKTSATVEGCGTGSSPISFGFVNTFSYNDISPFYSIDCRQAVFAWDPNDKQAFPEGYGPQHAIEVNTGIKYRVRFQNTGTAPALDVKILDTLSTDLDLLSLQVLGASHPYTWSLNNEILEVRFDNINLPDSISNEPASHGFVDYRIRPKANTALGTVINNRAGIYFDQNPVVLTNTTFHTIDSGFVVPLVSYQIDTTVCDSFVLHEVYYDSTGTFSQGLWTPTEYRDYTINLTTHNSNDVLAYQTDCDSFTWNGQTYMSSGIYTQNYTNIWGCDSIVTMDLTLNNSVSNTLFETSCEPYTWNGQTYNSSGFFMQTLTSSLNCDSLVTLLLTIDSINIVIQTNPTSLISVDASANAYQWIDCATNQPIAAATNRTFSPMINGNYAVIITKGNCVDTSACQSFVLSNTDIIGKANTKWQVYPNPTTGILQIVLEQQMNAAIMLTNQLGQLVLTNNINSAEYRLDMSNLLVGIYYLTIRTDNHTQQIKVVKK